MIVFQHESFFGVDNLSFWLLFVVLLFLISWCWRKGFGFVLYLLSVVAFLESNIGPSLFYRRFFFISTSMKFALAVMTLECGFDTGAFLAPSLTVFASLFFTAELNQVTCIFLPVYVCSSFVIFFCNCRTIFSRVGDVVFSVWLSCPWV